MQRSAAAIQPRRLVPPKGPHADAPLRQVVYALVLLLFLCAPSGAQNKFVGKVTEVEAGDRVRVRLDGWEMTVRLHGITCDDEAPDLAEVARHYTSNRVAGTPVRVEVRGTGAKQTVYGEVYPTLGTGKASLNQELVRVGLARWARAYAPNRDDIASLEDAARTAGRGQWSDPTGKNVPLPPVAALTLRATPRPTPTPKARPTPRATATPEPRLTPAPPVTKRPARSATPQAAKTAVTFPAGTLLPLSVFLLVTGATGASLARAARHVAGRATASILPPALLTGVGAALCVPLPLTVAGYASTGKAPTSATDALVVLLALPLAALCIRQATILQGWEQSVRGTPPATVESVLARGRAGWVRVCGQTEAPLELVQSHAGQIPGVYIREVVLRYESQSDGRYDKRGGRSVAYRWAELRNETQTAPFVLRDDTGSVWIDGAGADFHPLRVARFYNDVPVETFFDKPYSGDTKTEVFFIPARADVTVWGQLYHTASSLPGTSEWRIGPDARTGKYLIVEGNPGRVFTRRGLHSLLLWVGATLFLGLAAFSLLSPRTLGSGISPLALNLALFFGGGLLLWTLRTAYQDARLRLRAWQTAWWETEAVLHSRHTLAADLITHVSYDTTPLTTRLNTLTTLPPHPLPDSNRFHAEQQLSALLLQATHRWDTNAALPTALPSLELAEQQLSPLRERYNRTASVWNETRSSFPHGLLLRTLLPSPLPLWEGQ